MSSSMNDTVDCEFEVLALVATPRMIRLVLVPSPCAGLESPGVLAMMSLTSLAPRFKSSSADSAVMLIGTS